MLCWADLRCTGWHRGLATKCNYEHETAMVPFALLAVRQLSCHVIVHAGALRFGFCLLPQVYTKGKRGKGFVG